MLEGPRVNVRLFTEADLEAYCTACNRLESRGDHLPIGLRPVVEWQKQFKETGWWEEHQGRLMITDKQGRMLGDIGFFRDRPFQSGYEIGYSIFRPQDRGKGYMTEALRLITAYLFEAKPIPRLQLHTTVENVPSQRVAQKCGYTCEGTMRQYCFVRGAYRDCMLFSILRGESPPLCVILGVHAASTSPAAASTAPSHRPAQARTTP